MSRISTLWHLQTVDEELETKNRRMSEITDHLASDPASASAQAAHEASEKKLAELRATLRARELEAKSLDAKGKELEARLYGGRVTNPKELDGIEKENQMVKRQRSALDDQMLELMESIEQAQARAQGDDTALNAAKSARAQTVERLSREAENLSSRLADLAAERERLRGELDPDTLRTYDHQRRKTGRALAQVRRDACSACGVEVPIGLIQRVRSGEEIVHCSGCGRILAS